MNDLHRRNCSGTVLVDSLWRLRLLLKNSNWIAGTAIAFLGPEVGNFDEVRGLAEVGNTPTDLVTTFGSQLARLISSKTLLVAAA